MRNPSEGGPVSTSIRLGATLRPAKTAELLADEVRRRIVSGELRPDTVLPSEGELMKQFAVARPTVREAMRLLEADGLVAVRRGAPARVTSPDPLLAARLAGLVLQMEGTTFDDVFQSRLVIEPACARRLAQTADGDAIAALEAVLTDESKGDSGDAGEPFGIAFHDAVIELCGSNTLRILCGMLRHITYAHSALATEVDRQDPNRRAEHVATGHGVHERLLQAVRRGDEDEAERVWRSHLQGLSVVLVEQLRTLDLGAALATYRR